MISNVWTTHLKDPDQRKEFELVVRNSSLALGRLKDIFKDMDTAAMNVKFTDYDSPSWSHKQADYNGYRRCIRDLMTLLKFLDKEKQ